MDDLRRRLIEAEEVLPKAGRVRASGRRHPAWVFVDDGDVEVEVVTRYLRDLALTDCRPGTAKAYAYGLQWWFRLLWRLGVDWDAATRTDLEVLVGYLRSADNPQRRRSGGSVSNPGGVNPLTGKAYLGRGYSGSYIDGIQSAISGFYTFHAESQRGPVVNPVPANRERPDAVRHRSPLEDRPQFRRAPLRQRRAAKQPRAMSDERYDEFMGAQRCDRDRALVAMFVSSGARAAELLNVGMDDIDWGGMRFWVVSKGSRLREEVPASPEAMRLLAKYLDGIGPVPDGEPIWRTRRGPDRPLTYQAMRRVIQRSNEALGTNWTAHDFRHTLATRLSRDAAFRTEEIQKVLRHASMATTGRYQHMQLDDVIDRLAIHYEKPRVAPRLGAGYSEADMKTVFGV